MAGLPYVGPKTTDAKPRGVQTRAHVDEQLNAGITREYVDGQVITLSAPNATKTYVDTQDNLYADTAYYVAQDELLVPTSTKGQPNGVASLDATSTIPLGQIPALGVGTLKGPYGLTSTALGNTGATPLKIGEFALGLTGVNFKPLAFLNVVCGVLGRGRPVIEVRIGTNVQTTYAAQTLVAAGYGRAMFDDTQPVNVKPAPDALNVMQDGIQTFYGPNTNYVLYVWVFDSTGAGQITIASGGIATASAWLVRVVQ